MSGQQELLFSGGEATLTGGMQVMIGDDELIYPGIPKNQNVDLVSGQHQVVRVNGQIQPVNRQTTTTVFENQSNQNDTFIKDHHISNATINDQNMLAQQTRLGNQTLQRGPNTGLDEQSNIRTAEGSMMRGGDMKQKLDLEPTKGVLDQGTVKRSRGKLPAQDEDEDDDDDDVAEIGTHRKESQHGSQNELGTVNRFNSATKNQSIN